MMCAFVRRHATATATTTALPSAAYRVEQTADVVQPRSKLSVPCTGAGEVGRHARHLTIHAARKLSRAPTAP